MNGTGQQLVSEKNVKFTVYKDWVIYYHHEDGVPCISKMRTDGSSSVTLYEGQIYYTLGSINVFDDWIYFEYKNRACRMRYDGSDFEVISQYGLY